MSHTGSRPGRRSLRLLAPALAVAAAGALLVPSAQAATPATAAVTAATAPSRAVPAAEQRAVARLDKAAIVRKAKAAELPRNVAVQGKLAVQGPGGPTVSTAPRAAKGVTTSGLVTGKPTSLAATASGSSGSVWPYSNTSNPNRQVGKLYFDTDPGPGYTWSWCTATVVNSENRSTLLTAGHCVWNASARRWYQNLWFYPGYQYGASSLGAWSVRNISTTWNYFNYGTSADDMAAVVVNRDGSNRSIVDVTGAMGTTFNGPTNQYRWSFGYPVTDWRWPGYTADGEDARWCYGTDWYYSSGSFAGQNYLPCSMTGGASGGPWLTNVRSDWLGWVNSVNSNKGGIGAGWAQVMFGPYFGNEELQVFNTLRAA